MQKFNQEQLDIAFRNAVEFKEDLPEVPMDGTIVLVKDDFKLYGYISEEDDWKVVAGGGGGNTELKQLTRLGVVANTMTPHVTQIPMAYTETFDLPGIEVLEFVPGEGSIMQVFADFDNSDSTDFEENIYVKFDGNMYLRNDFKEAFKGHTDIDSVFVLDLQYLDNFEKITAIKAVSLGGI